MLKMRYVLILLLLITSILFARDSNKEKPVATAEIMGSQIEVTYAIPKGMYQAVQKDYFYVDAEEVKGIRFEPTIYPEGEKSKDGLVKYYDKVTLIKKFTIDDKFIDKIKSIKVYAGYQFCDKAGKCFFPQEIEFELSLSVKDKSIISQQTETEEIAEKSLSSDNYDELKVLLEDFEIAGKEAGYQKSDGFITFLENSKDPNSFSSNKFADKSIWLIIILILIGGIVLNLTPCVLPMIPITIAVLGAGAQSESKAKGFLIGGTYGLGMALAYGLLGVIVILTGSQFGTINSSPWFNLIIAVIFIILSLAMFDIIPIDLSKFQSGNIGSKSKSKFVTVFILGVIAAVLAGACVAPVLISVILYSTSLYTSGNPAGLLLPFLLGVGMAIPWPFAGAGLSFLPKPGNWMKWVKIIFGIMILIIAVFYIYTGIKIFKSNKQVEVVDYSHETSDLPWIHSLSEGLKIAKEQDKPVFIDFWATWCKNCLYMDATTFKDEKVIKEFENFVLVKYQAENLKVSPTKEILRHFKIIGLPTYLVLVPKK